jgi:outer membrane protein OmpA-like peptidoglycan-associated protein
MKTLKSSITGFLFFLLSFYGNNAFSKVSEVKIDSLINAKELINQTQIKSSKSDIALTIKNADMSDFPIIKFVCEAFNKFGEPLDTILVKDLTIFENGKEKKIISIEKLPPKSIVLVDFVFIIDQTGSMQKYIDDVRKNIIRFTSALQKRGIDYRISLVLFSDIVEEVYPFTENVDEFKDWLSKVKAGGGKDEKENALEAIKMASSLKFRSIADKVLIILTDAPYHQKGEDGVGKTEETTNSILKILSDNDQRFFSIVPKGLSEYEFLSERTRGNTGYIGYPFSSILDKFSNQLTNLYVIKYNTSETTLPDSLEITILDKDKNSLVKDTVQIMALADGEKLKPYVLENLLYQTNSYDLPDSVKELNLLADYFLKKEKLSIIIEGHTDSRGSDYANLVLSNRRAESVKRYLVKKGIHINRIKTVGHGESKPIASNNTEEGRKLNRRTEIYIMNSK